MKKSQSPIVASVLLILIVVVAAIIIIAFVVPFVKNQLAGSDCIEVSGEMEITNDNRYTCYDSSREIVFVQVHAGDIEDKIDGFVIELGGASSDSYEISNGNALDNIYMYNGGDIEIPKKNTERTYNITMINKMPDSITLYPILKNGKTCEASDISTPVDECSNPYS